MCIDGIPPLEGESQKRLHTGLGPGPGYHSPLEGESQKPSRQASADAVGGLGCMRGDRGNRQPTSESIQFRRKGVLSRALQLS
ncbi:MAG: hypothetical protein F4201_04300 [Nitrospira sp. SB0677_bin_15]|nr:hypothetical protein [Nitrospira sp. SB0667_bin_9]MYD32068.1 hypothetical protein [Nitrospira sp. SB0661_bin_20]MYG40029.1 hypothetical protein [Nitrospira sp. SB0677_bin_15]MYH01739.1 hypothetical protein [Nitrospira sp. SB0675_bin_23]MYJ23784.1 hypothetical protein [Nitrospira sp. SB0673_bin_12]